MNSHPDMVAHQAALHRAHYDAAEKFVPMCNAVKLVLYRRQPHPDAREGLSRALAVLDMLCDGLAPTAYYREAYAAALPALAHYPELAVVLEFFKTQACR